MSLQTQITDDLKTSMKARDRARTSALRMVLAAMKNKATAEGRGPQGELSDEEVQGLLATEVKKRREAADAYRSAGRAEQAASEEAEAEVYAQYLPEQMADEELEAIVDATIAEVGATSPREMGQVMQAVMGAVGKQAEGSRVSALVKAKLTG
ncbi:MAG TPA: GatB/YqeY domain-containing protein [Nitriliruptorales bacterium]